MNSMVSIIIISFNCLPYLQITLNSVIEKTAYPYELIVIDNNSNDGSVEWLQNSFAKKIDRNGLSGRVKLLFNRENRGYSRACNQGLKQASGEYLALLNADLMVSPGWLGRLVEHLQEDPGAGMVGPVGKIFGGEQNYVFIYHEFAYLKPEQGLDRFAEELYQHFQGDYTESKFLLGCCLLLNRKVLVKVGLFDESLYMSADDFDYSLRVRMAGYHLYVAEDVFVHHYNHQSFASLAEKDADRRIEECWQAFRKKWSSLLKKYSMDDLFYNQRPLFFAGLNSGRRAGQSSPTRQSHPVKWVLPMHRADWQEPLPADSQRTPD